MNIGALVNIIIIFFISGIGYSQVSFEDQTLVYNPNLQFHSGSCGAFADANGDGLDDLIVIDRSTHMHIGYNMGAGFPMNWQLGPKVSSSREYLCLLSDLNNNGIREVITSGAYSRTKIYNQQSNGTYNFKQQIKRSILAQGGNTIDLNQDNFLDLFVCSDDDGNMIALNTNGSLNVEENFIDWSTNPISNNSGNYASEWADYNGDGLLDLSIAKCRLGVNDPTDPQRINRLFIRQQDGTYIDEAKSRNVNIGWQSWTTSTIDYDNDGDFDLFVSNHDFNHQLLVNDGNGYFSEVNFTKLPVNNFSYQSIIRDYDNNGFQDILIVGQGVNLLLTGAADGQFGVIGNPLGRSANSAIVGDINQDGKIDIMAMHSRGINNPGVIPDEIFINTTANKNTFIDIQLIGTTSNRDAVGTLIKLYSNVGVQTQVIQSGESYGITNSYTRHFGLGENPIVDSLVVQWPSGNKDVIFPKNINTMYVLKEGFCFKDNITLVDSTAYLCGDSVTIEGPTGQSNYLWSTGDTTKNLLVGKPGVYVLTFNDDEGCNVRSNPVLVQNGIIGGNLFSENIITSGCFGKVIKLNAPSASKILNWSTGDVGPSISVDTSALIYLSVIDQCGISYFDSLDINIVDPTIKEYRGDTVAMGENAQLYAEGEGMSWFISATSPTQIYNGNTLSLFNVEESRAYYAEQEVSRYTSSAIGGILDEQASLTSSFNNYGLALSAIDNVLLKSAKVYALVPGEREVIIDKMGQLVFQKSFDLKQGWNDIEFNLEILPNEVYNLSTSIGINFANFGTDGPELSQNISNLNYPYLIGNSLILTGETNGAEVYPYFYDIQIESNPITCKSERQAVWVYLDKDVSSIDLDEDKIQIFPNPVIDKVIIKSETALSQMDYYLYDINGLLLIKGVCGDRITEINMQDFDSGMYFIRIGKEDSFLIKKVIKL